MGVVYRAFQREPGREVALKVLRPGAVSPQLRARFGREAEALRRLDHPGIARFLEAGVFETSLGHQPYFSMEYVEGTSLREFLRSHAPDLRERLQLLAALCDAVHYAHQQSMGSWSRCGMGSARRSGRGRCRGTALAWASRASGGRLRDADVLRSVWDAAEDDPAWPHAGDEEADSQGNSQGDAQGGVGPGLVR